MYSQSQIWGEWSLKPQCSQEQNRGQGWVSPRQRGAVPGYTEPGGRGECTNETLEAAGEEGQKGDKDRQTET